MANRIPLQHKIDMKMAPQMKSLYRYLEKHRPVISFVGSLYGED